MKQHFGVDLTPLRVSKEYRKLYVAGLITALGSQATYVTIPYQLKELTHSPLDVGALGLFELVPLVVFGLYGGVLADRLNRRRLIITMEALLMLATAVVLVNALLPHPQVWILYVDAVVAAAVSSLQRPSIEALNQTFVPHELQRAASTLANIRFTSASIVGPALGGLVAVAAGPGFVYGANLVTFSISLFLLSGLAHQIAPVSTDDSDRAALRAGVSFLRSRPDIVGTYIIDLLAMTFAFPVAMLPFVATRFHSTYALSLLYCGLPAGALTFTLLSGWTKRVHHYGRAVVASAAMWGLGIAIFGYSSSLWLVLVGLGVAGGADSLSGIFRATMWNESIPPDIRGRMAGMEMISYSLGPTAGQFRAGVMAAWTTLRFSLTVGGLACTGSVGVVAAALPSLWSFDARTDVHVASVRELRARDDQY
ncbi:MAG TPA: MFS transporter [Acidimicrobiales bacterium]